MPAATNISINDATPTAHVFVPVGKSGNVVNYRNVADATISAAEETLSLSLSRSNATRATDRVKITFSMPFEQTVDGEVTVRDVARFSGEFILPNTMTTTERADFQKIVSNGFDATDVAAHVTSLTPTW